MLLKNYKNTQIFRDRDKEFLTSWFNIKDKKVIHNIDTLYCTAEIIGDYNALALSALLPFLEELKVNREFEDIYLDKYDLYFTGLSFNQYTYCLEKKDNFLIFFSRKKSTVSTPSIFIQIRSQALWLKGEHQCLLEVNDTLTNFLSDYNIQVAIYKENRIDFAYHTNYIKDMTSFFNIERLNSMQVSRFEQCNLVLKLKGDDETKTEYISFGKRTSNNLFIRMYDKTNEVVEQGYKQFFLEHWFDNGLINSYDKWIYEKCFMDRSLRKVHFYRLEFYKAHGKDENMLIAINEINDKSEYDVVKNLADKLTPKPTLIVNIEFQTKRKFYYTFDTEVLNILKSITVAPQPLFNIFRLLDNKKLIHNLLTEDVFRLVNIDDPASRKRDKSILPFWKLIQDCKIVFKGDTEDVKLRKYQRNLDVQAIKKRLVHQIATFSLYIKGENENDLIKDSLDFMEWLNESDIEKAEKYKKKKVPLLKSKLESTGKLDFESRYALVNIEDGTYIE